MVIVTEKSTEKKLQQLIARHYRSRMLILIAALYILGFLLVDRAEMVRVLQGANSELVYLARPVFFNWIVQLLLALFGGILLTRLDYQGHFNEFLFSSGYRRTNLFWHRQWFLSKYLLLALLLEVILDQGAIAYVLNGDFTNFDWRWLVIGALFSVLMTYFAFLVGQLLGTIFGQSLIAYLVGFYLVILFLTSFTGLRNSAANSRLEAIGDFIALFVIGFGVVMLQRHLFVHDSLENNGQYLRFEKLKWPIFVLLTLVTGIYATMSWNGSKPSVVVIILVVLVVAVVQLGLMNQNWLKKALGIHHIDF